MDGRGAWRDNVFVERLWRSVKYEEVYLRAYDSVAEARACIGRYLDFYNRKRPHSSLGARTPDQAYFHHHQAQPRAQPRPITTGSDSLNRRRSLSRQSRPALFQWVAPPPSGNQNLPRWRLCTRSPEVAVVASCQLPVAAGPLETRKSAR